MLVVGGDHVGRVPPCDGRGGALHDDQADGRLRGGRVGGVLLGGVLSAAVVHDAGDQEDQQEHDIAGDEDAQVERDRVDLLVVLQKTHGDIARGGVASAALTPRERGRESSAAIRLAALGLSDSSASLFRAGRDAAV